MNNFLMGVVTGLLANEILGASDWLADRIARWAARRWLANTGNDYLDDFLDDLAQSPTHLFKLLAALWILLGTFVGPARLTLNLPSLWRLSQPARAAVRDLVTHVVDAARQRSDPSVVAQPTRRHVAAIMAAARLLPRTHRELYAEEWTAELYYVPKRRRTGWTIGLVVGALLLAPVLRRRAEPPGR